MKQYLIAHRGNLSSIESDLENTPSYIDKAIQEGFDVEIDVWFIDDTLYLGHDEPQYEVNFRWFRDRINKIWIHCKNSEAMLFFNKRSYKFNYFWHQEDMFTITSKNIIWQYPSDIVYENAIFLMPEKFPKLDKEELKNSLGICSDFIADYKKL
jgi:hypothetical protein